MHGKSTNESTEFAKLSSYESAKNELKTTNVLPSSIPIHEDVKPERVILFCSADIYLEIL